MSLFECCVVSESEWYVMNNSVGQSSVSDHTFWSFRRSISLKTMLKMNYEPIWPAVTHLIYPWRPSCLFWVEVGAPNRFWSGRRCCAKSRGQSFKWAPEQKRIWREQIFCSIQSDFLTEISFYRRALISHSLICTWSACSPPSVAIIVRELVVGLLNFMRTMWCMGLCIN